MRPRTRAALHRDAQLLQHLTAAHGQRPVLERRGERVDTWRVGGLRLDVPRVLPSMPPELAAGLRTWAAALLSGRCPRCGQVWHVHVGQVVVPHDADCAAAAGVLAALAAAGRVDVGAVVLDGR